MTNLLANNKGRGALPLGSKCGNVDSAFHAGHHMDIANSTAWAGDRDVSAGNSRRASGGNHANPSPGKPRSNALSELSNVNGRGSKKDGQRYGGSPAKSGSSRGPSGRKSKSKGISGR